jgi:hypothetical protein
MKSEYKLGGIIETETVIILNEEVSFLWEWMFQPPSFERKEALFYWVVIVIKCQNFCMLFSSVIYNASALLKILYFIGLCFCIGFLGQGYYLYHIFTFPNLSM